MATYACADLHGQGWAWDKIKNIITKNDTLYFIGDAIDRGPDGYRILTDVLSMPNCKYICGNHDKMCADTLTSDYWEDRQLWYYNGGRVTENSIPENEKNKLAAALNVLPYKLTYNNTYGNKIIMTHSGLIDGADEDMLWDRTHFIGEKWYGVANEYIVHGHTPIPYLIDEKKSCSHFSKIPYESNYTSGALFYCEGHKIDIDCGVHFSDYTVLLNLDTFEEMEIRK